MGSDICEECGGPLILLRSQYTKLCPDCGAEFVWPLKEGQKPLVSSNRDRRQDAPQGHTESDSTV